MLLKEEVESRGRFINATEKFNNFAMLYAFSTSFLFSFFLLIVLQTWSFLLSILCCHLHFSTVTAEKIDENNCFQISLIFTYDKKNIMNLQ